MPRSTEKARRPTTSIGSSAGRCGPTRSSPTGAGRLEDSISPATMFGLEPGDEHTFSAEAIAESKVLVIKRSAAVALAERDNEVARQLWNLTGRELSRVQDH